MNKASCVAALAFLFVSSVHAGTWDSEGQISLESRAFTPDKNGTTSDWGLGIYARLYSKATVGPFNFVGSGFGRVDRADTGRNIVAFEDTYLGLQGAGWDVRAGYQIVNWGALEFFNPSDIINSRNFDSDVEAKEKFGELMFSITRSLWEGAEFTVAWMPRFEDPKLPGIKSRLSFVDASQGGFSKPYYIERTGVIAPDRWNGEQFAARFTQNVGNADFSFHGVYHMDRHQALLTIDSSNVLHPTYFPVLQIGGTYMHVLGSWIVKGEFVYRKFNDPSTPPGGITSFPVPHGIQRDDHSIGALGLEYGLGHSNGWLSTFVVEGISIFGTTDDERKSLQIFQRDILLAYNLAINDVDAKELTLAVIFDCESVNEHEVILNLQYAQRLTDTWKVKTGLRIIEAPQQAVVTTTGLQALDRVAYLYFNLTRSF